MDSFTQLITILPKVGQEKNKLLNITYLLYDNPIQCNFFDLHKSMFDYLQIKYLDVGFVM